MDLQPGTILNNMYRVDRHLGKGAMGDVYLVQRLSDNKFLVVKELILSTEARLTEETAREIFFREAEFIAKFDHPGLPKMHGVFSQDGHDYLAMEYIKGETLEEKINSSKNPFPTQTAFKWAIEIAQILDYLHNSFNSPIVYRDLKPANIMITPENKARLIDFGISRYYNPDKNTDTFRLGSPGYAAPEQYKGKGQSSPQTDVFALGVILFALLTKYDPTLTPFKFPSMRALNPSVSNEVEAIIRKAIELKPLNRYISAVEFKEILEKYLANFHPGAVLPGTTQKPAGTLRKKPPPPVVKAQINRNKNLSAKDIIVIMGLFALFIFVFIPKCPTRNTISGERYDPTAFSCVDNMINIASHLRQYYGQKGKYPPSLDVLPGNKNFPTCPASHMPYIYCFSSDAKNFTLCCGGTDVHKDSLIKGKGHFPQYSSIKGRTLQ